MAANYLDKFYSDFSKYRKERRAFLLNAEQCDLNVNEFFVMDLENQGDDYFVVNLDTFKT